MRYPSPIEELLIHITMLFVIMGLWIGSFILAIEIGRYLGFPVA